VRIEERRGSSTKISRRVSVSLSTLSSPSRYDGFFNSSTSLCGITAAHTFPHFNWSGLTDMGVFHGKSILTSGSGKTKSSSSSLPPLKENSGTENPGIAAVYFAASGWSETGSGREIHTPKSKRVFMAHCFVNYCTLTLGSKAAPQAED
jgi:hypothetical protein